MFRRMFRRSRVVGARFRAVLRREAAGLRQGSAALLVSTAASLLAGLVLGGIRDTLERLPGLLVLVPPVLALRGNISGALGSRLATAVRAGTFRRSWRRESLLGQNLWAAAGLSLSISLVFALMVKGAAIAFGITGAISVADFIVISVLGGAIASSVVIAFTVAMAIAGVQRGWDLDTVNGPIATAAGDLVTLPSLWVASYLVEIRWVTGTLGLVCAGTALAATWAGLRSPHRSERSIVRQSLPILTLAGMVSVIAGVSIESRLETLVAFPALLILIPPFLAVAGSLGAIFSSRIATKLHLGLIDPRRIRFFALAEELLLVACLAAPMFVLVATLADLIGAAAGLASPGSVEMVEVALLAGTLATVALVVVGYAGSVVAFLYGLDPDNYAIPVVTSTLDLVGAFAVILSLVAVGVV